MAQLIGTLILSHTLQPALGSYFLRVVSCLWKSGQLVEQLIQAHTLLHKR